VTDLPRFLIAKYVPDVFRNEPRNIGVVLWSPDGVAARFAGERADAPGEINDADVPPFVVSPVAYKQWVRYWRRELSSECVRPTAGGPPVGRSAPEYLDALRETGPGNYLLTDGGRFAEPVPAVELPQAVDYLFERYVAEPPPLGPRPPAPEAESRPEWVPSKTVREWAARYVQENRGAGAVLAYLIHRGVDTDGARRRATEAVERAVERVLRHYDPDWFESERHFTHTATRAALIWAHLNAHDAVPESDESGLRALLAKLADDERELLRLRYEEDRTVAEIAELQGTTENRVWYRMNAAQQRLRSLRES
jgi:hypothetical protein